MKAEFTEIEVLEELAAAMDPSLDGSMWITLQIVEHIINSISERDKLSNKYISSLMADILERYQEILSDENAVRPLPNDTVQQMISYTQDVIESLMNKPKGKMIKVDAIVPSYKLKNAGSKTMNWIGKQPGRTIKDKLAGKNRVLTQVNEFSYDIKENQVVSMIIKEMKSLISTRINIGIENQAYDVSKDDDKRYDEMDDFLKLERKFKKSKLANVKAKVVIQPNNTLISDKYYSKMWRAYQQILDYKKSIEKKLNHVLERYTSCIYLSILSELAKIRGIALINQVSLISDTEGLLKIKKLKEGNFNDENDTEFLVVASNINTLYGKVEVVDKEKNYALVFIGKVKYFLGKSNLKDVSKFDQLERGQKIFFTVSEKDDKKIKSIVNDEEIYSIKTSLEDTNINIIITKMLFNEEEAKYEEEQVKNIVYEFKESKDGNLAWNRGVNFTAYKYEEKVKNKKWTLCGYGDIKGIRAIKNMIISEILSVCNVRKELDTTIIKNSKDDLDKLSDLNSCWILDFINYNPIISSSNLEKVDIKKDLYSFQVTEESSKRVYVPEKNSIIKSNVEIISMNDLISDNNKSQADIVTAFDSILGTIKDEIKYDENKYLIYMVPDSIDEFTQKNMKRLFRVNFQRVFPIWRSIAAAISYQDKVRIDKDSKFLVVDCNGESSSATLMKVKYSKELNDFIFERFAPYDCNDDENPVNKNYCIESYLNKFILKYNMNLSDSNKEFLIKVGAIEDSIINKKDRIQIIFQDNKEIPIKIFYDEILYKQVIDEIIENFKEYSINLKQNISENNISNILLIGDHFTTTSGLKIIADDILCIPKFSKIKNESIIKGAALINERLINSLPTWHEHLPDLSLEVVKNGCYDKIDLIKNTSIENIMGKEQIFKVKEILTLDAGHKEFKFPLLKGTSSKANKEFNAIIRDKAFPLKEKLDVELTIRYIYGNENSYELILEPANKEEKIFKNIIAEWCEDNNNVCENLYPNFPDIIINDKEVEILESLLGKIERFFTRVYIHKSVSEEDIKFVKTQIFKAMLSLQRLMCGDLDNIEEVILSIKKKDVIKYMGIIIGIISDENGLVDLLESVSVIQTKFLKSTIAEFLCSFGDSIIPSLKNYIISSSEDYKSSALGKMIFLNGKDSEILDVFEKSYLIDGYNIIRSVDKSLWADKSLIINLYKSKPNLIEKIVSFIEYRLKNMSVDSNPPATLFKDFLEVLLATVRLREFSEFHLLSAGVNRCLRLSKYIKTIDRKIFINGGAVRTFIRFDVTKPASLNNMSDLAYVLNVYLTGEKGANLIQVKSIED